MKWLQLIKKHKIAAILSIVSFILIICLIVSVSVVAVKNEKDKQNRTFLDRDKTEIVCRRSEKIGSTILQYKTKSNPDNWKTTLFLYCTENPVIDYTGGNDYHQLQWKIEENFYNKYEKKWI